MTTISWNGAKYEFVGMMLLSHFPLDKVNTCYLLRYQREYRLNLVRENAKLFYCIEDLDLFFNYIYNDLLKMSSFDMQESLALYPGIHFMPKFSAERTNPEENILLPMHVIIDHLVRSHKQISKYVDSHSTKQCYNVLRNQIAVVPREVYPCFRVDDLVYKSKSMVMVERFLCRCNTLQPGGRKKIHCQSWRPSHRARSSTDHSSCFVDAEKSFLTGVCSQICQHALIIPALIQHIVISSRLSGLEEQLGYCFVDNDLLQVALTHVSRCCYYGADVEEVEKLMCECGKRKPYIDATGAAVSWYSKPKGFTSLHRGMTLHGWSKDTHSRLRHNETLEFLGDAVLELHCSMRLFCMFSDKPEGMLSAFRTALIQNEHLRTIAKRFRLEKHVLFPTSGGQETEMSFLADCVEAIIGAVHLDGGMASSNGLVQRLLFSDEELDLSRVWSSNYKHPLQLKHPGGDRHMIESHSFLQNLVLLEDSIGITFNHICLLAKAMTHPQSGFNFLTLGNNQRLEFLGDSVMKFLVSDHLYRRFPVHHEGHLTWLRTTLVNASCQANLAYELGLNKYLDFGVQEIPINASDKLMADVFEAFIGALFVDKGLVYCQKLLEVCLFPKLKESINNQDWIDPKSLLQQVCFSSPLPGASARPKPNYRILTEQGSGSSKSFKVAVYLNHKRIGTGSGISIQDGEMAAARDALRAHELTSSFA